MDAPWVRFLWRERAFRAAGGRLRSRGWVSGGLRPVTFLVVRRPGADRRSPMPGYAVDEAFARSREAFARAVEWLAGPEAAGLDHAAVEEGLAARGREMQRLLFQDYLDGRAA